MADKTSPEYAMLPAGTIVKYGGAWRCHVSAETAD